MRKLVFFLIISFFLINNVFAVVSETECATSAPSNSDGTKESYQVGTGNPGTCEDHNFYNSSTYTVSGINNSCVATAYNDCKVDCGDDGFPISFNVTTLTCIRRDDIDPLLGDIQFVTPTTDDLLATNSQSITVQIDRGIGPFPAPITRIEGQFDNITPINTPYNFTITSSTSSCGINCDSFFRSFDISRVEDNSDNGRISGGPNDGGRRYTYKITRICDEATNCTNLSYPVYYNVYANTETAGFNPFSSVGTGELNNSHALALRGIMNIADGDTDFDFDITLEDIYGNEIVPATGIDREIDFNFDKNNSLYLNQYNRTGSSSVLVKTPNSGTSFSSFPIGNGITTFANQQSSDGVYYFGFKVYTPTSNSYAPGDPVSDIDAEFLINNVNINISGTGGLGARSGVFITNSNNIDFRFSPLFTTTISGDLIDDGSFLEGSNQRSSINVTKNPLSSEPLSSGEVYLEFSSGATNTESTKVGLSLSGSQSPGFVSLLGGNPTGGLFNLLNRLPGFLGNYDIETILNLSPGATYDNISNSHFSTHIRYDLDGYDISYNGDTFGKDSYWDGASGTGATLGGVKVLGLSTSTEEKSHELITGQDEDSLHLLGDFIKANLKQDVRRNAYILTKNIDIDNGLYQINDLTGNIWNNPNGKIIYDDSILYFSGTGNLVKLSDGTGALVEGNKTIILEGLDLYINSNMYYGDKEKDILGIIVLKNKSGSGGNIYINPDVTNIVGNIYADKSVISADNSLGSISNKIESSEELGGGLSQSVLKNQLHIYGSVFSENTLGGSRANPITCPYYITSGDCITGVTDLEKMNEAQKYDLNYLRRYTLNGSDIPLNNGKVIGAGTCSSSLDCSGEIKYARYLTGTVDEYASYPVIIEYNPIIQYSPPPLFTK